MDIGMLYRRYVSWPACRSCGSSIPTLLAVNLTLSSSSIDMPGLYLSNKVAYILWAFMYWIYCSACSTCSVTLSGDKVVAENEVRIRR